MKPNYIDIILNAAKQAEGLKSADLDTPTPPCRTTGDTQAPLSQGDNTRIHSAILMAFNSLWTDNTPIVRENAAKLTKNPLVHNPNLDISSQQQFVQTLNLIQSIMNSASFSKLSQTEARNVLADNPHGKFVVGTYIIRPTSQLSSVLEFAEKIKKTLTGEIKSFRIATISCIRQGNDSNAKKRFVELPVSISKNQCFFMPKENESTAYDSFDNLLKGNSELLKTNVKILPTAYQPIPPEDRHTSSQVTSSSTTSSNSTPHKKVENVKPETAEEKKPSNEQSDINPKKDEKQKPNTKKTPNLVTRISSRLFKRKESTNNIQKQGLLKDNETYGTFSK